MTRQLSARQLFDDLAERLGLRWITGERGASREIGFDDGES
jgi:hypothetical protein